MNATAIKKMEIMNELSLIPDSKLDEIRKFIYSMIKELGAIERKNCSLHGIWKGKGFEKIIDLDAEIKTARRELSDAILKRKF